MSTVDEIKAAITTLSLEQRAELARWFHDWEDDKWDQQIASDAASGRLAKVLRNVDRDVRDNRLRDLP